MESKTLVYNDYFVRLANQQRSQRNYLILYIDCKFSCRRWCRSIDYTQNPLQNVNTAKEFAKTYKRQFHFDTRLKLNRFVTLVLFVLFAFGFWPWFRDILIHLNSLTFDRTTNIINNLIFHFFFFEFSNWILKEKKKTPQKTNKFFVSHFSNLIFIYFFIFMNGIPIFR